MYAERQQLIKDIERLELELREKRMQFARGAARRAGATARMPAGSQVRRRTDRNAKALEGLIEEIGRRSCGGDSVEDMRRERRS
jgi:hypothetical protein